MAPTVVHVVSWTSILQDTTIEFCLCTFNKIPGKLYLCFSENIRGRGERFLFFDLFGCSSFIDYKLNNCNASVELNSCNGLFKTKLFQQTYLLKNKIQIKRKTVFWFLFIRTQEPQGPYKYFYIYIYIYISLKSLLTHMSSVYI